MDSDYGFENANVKSTYWPNSHATAAADVTLRFITMDRYRTCEDNFEGQIGREEAPTVKAVQTSIVMTLGIISLACVHSFSVILAARTQQSLCRRRSGHCIDSALHQNRTLQALRHQFLCTYRWGRMGQPRADLVHFGVSSN